jgi:hypothetical protein
MQREPPFSLQPERESALIQDFPAPASARTTAAGRGANFPVDNTTAATPRVWESWPKGAAGVGPGALREIIKTMKFAAYTEETIWAVEDTEAAARTEGEATMRDNDALGQLAAMKVAPIDDGLVEALAKAEAAGGEVLFDLIDGELCEVETVDG